MSFEYLPGLLMQTRASSSLEGAPLAYSLFAIKEASAPGQEKKLVLRKDLGVNVLTSSELGKSLME